MKKILKFGGSSVAGSKQIRRVVAIVKDQPKPCAVVVSALGGVTDQLKTLAEAALSGSHDGIIQQIRQRHELVIRELLNEKQAADCLAYCAVLCDELAIICQGISMLRELSDRSVARLMSFGELLSSFIVNEAMKVEIPDAKRLDARQLILTDDDLFGAQVDFDETNRRIQKALNEVQSVAIIPGFISSTKEGVTSTLGRGGSDYTASLLAAALDVKELDIYSDVSGMLTANPKAVPAAQSIGHLSYNEAFELSHFGAKVLYPPAIQPAYMQKIPLVLKNTFAPSHPGTRIDEHVSDQNNIVTGISSIDEIAMVNLTGIGMVGITGYSSRVFSALHDVGVNVIMIAQSCSERGICVAVDRHALEATQKALQMGFYQEISTGRIDPIQIEDELSIIALVGDGMKYRTGVSGRVFSVLGDYGINIRAIAQGSSESNISIIIESNKEQLCIQKLHEVFIEKRPNPWHLFIVGVGNVGSQFLKLIADNQADLISKHNIDIIICGIANSQRMLLAKTGIKPESAIDELAQSTVDSDLSTFYDFANSQHLPNKIFIDNTASTLTAPYYARCLQNEIHVVTCNKIVASGDWADYHRISELSDKGPFQLGNETNVGAALPILRTIQDMVKSGDEIHRIQAVLSGSLGYIYNSYNGSLPFAQVVENARKLGYTEPNPMVDLSGVDVKRKIVIIARVAGLKIDLDNVVAAQDMPAACYETEIIPELFEVIRKNENYFLNKFNSAKSSGNKLKYLAEYQQGQCKISLQEVDAGHPFYHLNGTDNAILIYSKNYDEQPLVIQGAGAGPKITAAGVLTDILNIAK